MTAQAVTFEGSAGCNSYSGSYEVDEDKLSIKQSIGQTEMAYLEPIMEQETRYLTTLQDDEEYEIEDDRLEILAGVLPGANHSRLKH